MAFAVDIRHWPTAADLRAYLAGYDPAICAWVKGAVWHHTYRPLPNQWQGRSSLTGLVNFYVTQYNWDAGPHLVLVLGAPDPANDGIWQLTPLNVPGIHAGACNATHWGMEIAGDYDTTPWPDAVRDLVFGATDALFDWRGLAVTAQTVMGHRECLPNKSCPGTAIDLDAMRAAFAAFRQERSWAVQTISEESLILAPPRCTPQQATAYILSRPHPNYTSADISLTIVPAYVRICESAGVDPCLAIAQMVHETGNLSSYWSARPRRNPAGIGVTGQPGAGVRFATWANDAIPAHVGRLLAYALPAGQGTPAQQALIAKALSYRPLDPRARGSAPTLKPLGAVHTPTNVGKPPNQWIAGWAWPGTDYGARIAAIMRAMQEG